MRLYLLRHAQAEDTNPDESRALTRRGLRDVEKLGRQLRSVKGFKPRAIWHSPYVRATQTAQLLATELNFEGPLEIHQGITPYDSPGDFVDVCNELEESVVIVGHNPHLAMLAGRLLGTNDFSVSIEFKKCAMLCLERHDAFNAELPPLWTLRWFLVPHLFR
jgi:phosphohistidine phosphatase